MPDTWEPVRLGDLIALEYGRALPAELRSGEGYPVFGSSGESGRHSKALIQGPSIVVGRKGTVGSVVWSSEPSWPIDTAYWVRLRRQVDLRWLYWKLRTLGLERMDSSTGVPGLNREEAYGIPVLVPPGSEQRLIANILDTLDHRIQSSERVIAKVSVMRRGMVDELMLHGTGETSTTMRSGRLGDFLSLKRGFDITVAEQSDGQVPVISSSGITSYHNKAMVGGPGVVIGRKGKLGRAYYVECDFWPHDTSLWVTDFKGNNPKFISYFLEWLHLERFDAATSVPTLNRNFVYPLQVALPEPTDQIHIANEIESWEYRIQCEREILFKSQEAMQGLMDDLLTGRVRATDHGGMERVGTG